MLNDDDFLTEEQYAAIGPKAKQAPHPLCVFLRNLRLAKQMSLQQVETWSGMKAVVLGAYERGDREPPLSKLEAALRLWGYTLTAIPIGPDAVRQVSDVVAELRAIADQLEANAA